MKLMIETVTKVLSIVCPYNDGLENPHLTVDDIQSFLRWLLSPLNDRVQSTAEQLTKNVESL